MGINLIVTRVLVGIFVAISIHACQSTPADVEALDSNPLVSEEPTIEALQDNIARLKHDGAPEAERLAALDALAQVARTQAEYRTVVEAQKQIVEIAERTYGPEAQETLSARHLLISDLIEHRNDMPEVETLALSNLEARRRVYADESLEVASSKAVLAKVSSLLEKKDIAAELLQQSLKTQEALLPTTDPVIARTKLNLGTVYRGRGQLTEAITLMEEALPILLQTYGDTHAIVGQARYEYGGTLDQFGRLAEAEVEMRESLRIREELYGEKSFDAGIALMQLGQILRKQGRGAEAEPLLILALSSIETSKGQDHPAFSVALSILSTIYMDGGRPSLAVPVLERSLRLQEARGAPARATIPARGNLAYAQNELKNYEEADRLFRSVLSDLIDLAGPDAPIVAQVHTGIAANLAAMKKFDDAEAAYLEAIAIYDNMGDEVTDMRVSVTYGLGYSILRQGRASEAIPLLQTAVSDYDGLTGGMATMALGARASLAEAYAFDGDFRAAFDEAESTSESILQRVLQTSHLDAEYNRADRRRLRGVFHQLLRALSLIGEHDAELASPAHALTFQISQLVIASSAADAAEEAAIISRSSGTEGELGRKWRDLLEQKRLKSSEYVELLESDPASAADLAMDLDTLDEEIEAVTVALRSDAPHYLDLVSAQWMPLERFQGEDSVLEDKEAMLVILQGEDAVQAMFINRDMARTVSSDLSIEDVSGLVEQLRRSVDLADIAFAKDLPEFSNTASEQLYAAIVAPFEDELTTTDVLYVVSDGPISRLPLSLLSQQTGDGRNWLIDKTAIAVLPSPVSLIAARQLQASENKARRFLGVGDPQLEGQSRDTDLRSFAALRGSEGDAAQVFSVCGLAPLPETRAELQTLGALLGSDGADYLVGAAATERNLYAMNESGALNEYNLIAFATHALLSGTVSEGDNVESALVLSPPAGCEITSSSDDGLLSVSEIMSLKLSSEWVILSACNTSASDPSDGAEPLSGLAKAFFHAGAESLLVSHWDINSEATSIFMSQMFDPSVELGSRAETLRQAQISLRDHPPDGQAYYSHPAFWAPFSYIGADQ